MRLLIMETYNLRDFQIIGGPAWFKNDQWDIEAVADDGAALLMLNVEDPGTADCGKSYDAILDRESLSTQVSSRYERAFCV